MTLAIIAANTLVYGAWQVAEYLENTLLYNFLLQHFSLSQYGFFRKLRIYTAVTYSFSHPNHLHFLFNTIATYYFGLQVSAALGVARFLLLYFGGVVAGAAADLTEPFLLPPRWPASQDRIRDRNHYTVGNSAALCALVSWSALRQPRQIIYLFGILPTTAGSMVGLFVLFDLVQLYFHHFNINSAAHLGGYGAGFFLFRVFRRG